ncbi:hypothetical protein [Roseivirga sp.]|uniref:hypothetical protein n=1 Tax=Roseivirga sp. TaxID=1964215 RepID=UPI003B8ADD5A
MEELKTARVSNESSREVKTHSNASANSHGSQNFNHQRVSVRDIIENHYRKGK